MNGQSKSKKFPPNDLLRQLIIIRLLVWFYGEFFETESLFFINRFEIHQVVSRTKEWMRRDDTRSYESSILSFPNWQVKVDDKMLIDWKTSQDHWKFRRIVPFSSCCFQFSCCMLPSERHATQHRATQKASARSNASRYCTVRIISLPGQTIIRRYRRHTPYFIDHISRCK